MKRSQLRTDPEKVRAWQNKSRRRQLITRAPLNCRKVSKKPTRDGASERELRDEMDELCRQILVASGEDRCFVCAVSDEEVDLHSGHFISRKIYAIRWDVKRNLRRQCNECNSAHNEQPQFYRSMLVRDIGESEVCKLERIGRENPRVEYSQLLEIRDGLREELARIRY